jgi:hypothetical protein
MVTSCKNDKTKLQMRCNCMESHEVVNWMVTYYKNSSIVSLQIAWEFISVG